MEDEEVSVELPEIASAGDEQTVTREILLFLSWLVAKRRLTGRGAALRLRLMSVQSVVDGLVLHTFEVEQGAAAGAVAEGVLAGVEALWPRQLADEGRALREDLRRPGSRRRAPRMLILEWCD